MKDMAPVIITQLAFGSDSVPVCSAQNPIPPTQKTVQMVDATYNMYRVRDWTANGNFIHVVKK